MSESGYLRTRLEHLPEEFRQELQKLCKERNPAKYYVGGHQAFMPIFLLGLIVMAFLYILVMLSQTHMPMGVCEVDLFLNNATEYLLYLIMAVALAMLIVFMLIDIYRVWGRRALFHTSFGLVRQRGRQIEIFAYDKIKSMSMKGVKVRDPEHFQGKRYAGSIFAVKMDSGRNFYFDINNRAAANAFKEAAYERLGKIGADISGIKRTNSISSLITVPVYTILSLLFGMIVVRFLFLLPYNERERERIKRDVYQMRDGELVLHDNKDVLRAYLDTFPEGEERDAVLRQYKEVLLKNIRQKSRILVVSRDREASRNSNIYAYRSAIKAYNDYFKEAILQDELDLLYFDTFDQWFALLHEKGAFDKNAERQSILDLREKVAEKKDHWLNLYQAMTFYRMYFDDTEFQTEEEMLSMAKDDEEWRRAYLSGSVSAELE